MAKSAISLGRVTKSASHRDMCDPETLHVITNVRNDPGDDTGRPHVANCASIVGKE